MGEDAVESTERCRACGALEPITDVDGPLCGRCGWRVGDVPDDDLAPIRVEVVYYLRFRDRIKIGTSGNPRSRFGQLRFEELLAFELGGRELEHQRHLEFAEVRYPGSEWFVASDALLAHVIRIAGTGDPWTAYARWMSRALAERVSRG